LPKKLIKFIKIALKNIKNRFFQNLFQNNIFLFLLKVLKTRGNVFDSMASEKTFQLTGATTFGVTTFGVTTRGVTTRGVTTRSVTTRGVTTLGIMTFSKTTISKTILPNGVILSNVLLRGILFASFS
jgi:hypothetical protein